MQLHELKPKSKMRRGQRIGRGGKRGTTAGRGTKGQKARAGHKIRPAMRDIMKRLPKLRGYKFRSFQERAVVVSLLDLEKKFAKGELVTKEALHAKGLIHKQQGRLPRVKILGNTVSRGIALVGVQTSRGARRAIERAGGSVK
jgi:large subunit ribosomal protein L15